MKWSDWLIKETIEGERVKSQLMVSFKNHLANLTKKNVKRYILMPPNDQKNKKKKNEGFSWISPGKAEE